MRVLAFFCFALVLAVAYANPRPIEAKMDDVKILVNKENRVEKKDTNKAKAVNYDSYNNYPQASYASYPTYSQGYASPSYSGSSYSGSSYSAPRKYGMNYNGYQ